MTKKKILVTGGVGFIGTALIKKLLNEGHNVHSLDNYEIGLKENEQPGCHYHIGDIENINLVNSRLNRKDQKKSRWLVGFGVGYGVNLNNNQVISTGPSIGLGIYWSPKFLRF